MQVISNSSPPFSSAKSSLQRVATTKAPSLEPVITPARQTGKSSATWESKSFSFRDILDIINPLQHIPVISTIYRKITGDEMGYAAQIAGDTLYGGAVGSLVSSLVASIANVFVDSTTGKDIGEHMIAAINPQPKQEVTMPVRQAVAPIATNHVARSSTDLPSQYPARVQQGASEPKAAPIAMEANDKQVAAGIASLQDFSRAQVAIDQYKWQKLTDNVEEKRTGYWA
ncbi:MAG: hypothetical protein Q9M31_04810 [Mariprofundus sp.]|nr:hypothetical protein [Mariprofundus sp.]